MKACPDYSGLLNHLGLSDRLTCRDSSSSRELEKLEVSADFQLLIELLRGVGSANEERQFWKPLQIHYSTFL